jgi:hypothetical protein
MKPKGWLLAVLGCVLLWTITAAAAPGQKTETLKTGKKGEITLKQPTKIGDMTLQPDTYVVQHRVSGNDHFVRFVELKQIEARGAEAGEATYSTYTEAEKAGEIKCRVEPAGQTFGSTSVTITEDGVARITKVEIKGENVVHVLQ